MKGSSVESAFVTNLLFTPALKYNGKVFNIYDTVKFVLNIKTDD